MSKAEESEISCAWCGRARVRDGSWAKLTQIDSRKPASHGMCPACREAELAFEAKGNPSSSPAVTRPEFRDGLA